MRMKVIPQYIKINHDLIPSLSAFLKGKEDPQRLNSEHKVMILICYLRFNILQITDVLLNDC